MRRRGFWQAADVLLRFAVQNGFVNDVHVRLQLVVPVQDVQVARAEAEAPRLVKVPRSQREYDRDQDAEPEERGSEQEIVVAVDGSHKPPGGDERIESLDIRQLELQRKVAGEKGGGTHGVYPDEHNANKHGGEHPNGPNPREESVKQICGGSCGDDHRRRELVKRDVKSVISSAWGEVAVKENEVDDDGLEGNVRRHSFKISEYDSRLTWTTPSDMKTRNNFPVKYFPSRP